MLDVPAAPDALAVASSLAPPLDAEVVAWLESEAGWQVVGAGGPTSPRLHLVAPELLAGAAGAAVVVVPGPVEPALRRGLLRDGALDVIAWPDERMRLLDAPSRLPAEPSAVGVRTLRIAGTAGGVGCSTLALAIGGLVAWSGRRVVVVGDDDLLLLCGLRWRGPGAAELAALDREGAAVEVAALARPVPGVAGLWVLGGGAAALGCTAGWPFDAVVTDLRTALPRRLDVVVARADATVERLGTCTAGRVLLAPGVLPRSAVARHLDGPAPPWLQRSARVARAGLRGRVPADLPGTWLAAVADAVGLAGRPRRRRRR